MFLLGLFDGTLREQMQSVTVNYLNHCVRKVGGMSEKEDIAVDCREAFSDLIMFVQAKQSWLTPGEVVEITWAANKATQAADEIDRLREQVESYRHANTGITGRTY
jgi:hypothetical protein